MIQRLSPSRLLCPCNSPGKNTGVGCNAFSRGSSWPKDGTSCIAGRFLSIWATREAPNCFIMCPLLIAIHRYLGKYWFIIPLFISSFLIALGHCCYVWAFSSSWHYLLEKPLMLGKTEGERRRGQQRMRWSDGITDSMDMCLSKFWETREKQGSLAWCSSWGRRVGHDLVTEQ